MKKSLLLLAFIPIQLFAQCSWSKQEIDGVAGTSSRILDSERLFTLNVENKPTKNQDQEYKIARISLAEFVQEKDTLCLFYLNVEINSLGANTTYGSLRNGDKIMIELQSGRVFEFPMAGATNHGDVSYKTFKTYYSTYFQMTNEAIRIFSEDPLKKIRLYWSKGFEEYPVENPNILIAQLSCF